ncbi:DegT/DnrJ/EryC1/StrS aminotransferase family protein, partial [Parasphingorhabdus sp.]
TEEAKAAHDVLLSNRVNYWTGEECKKFEAEFADWAGTSHAIAVSNGTVAIEIALEACGIGAGDEVIVTPRTFLASASAIVRCGATPVFADIDTDSGNISAATIAPAISERTKAVICVHLGGWPCDMDEIMALSEAHDIVVIEDCAQAHGARYNDKPIGSIGHIGTWSFCQDKIMTLGGEGGMITTSDRALWKKMWSAKDHGKDWDKVHEKHDGTGFRWVHDSFGSNYRMTEMQAAIGRIQLKKLPEWTAARTRNAERLIETAEKFSGPEGIITIPNHQARHGNSAEPAWYKFYLLLNPEKAGPDWTRDRILSEFRKLDVPCYQGSCTEIYKEKAFDSVTWLPGHPLPNAADLGERSLMFLVHPTLTDEEISRTQSAMEQVFGMASTTASGIA